MPEPDLLQLFVAPLERLGLCYMVTGSIASMAYGEPRLTVDVDLVLDLRIEQIESFRAAFTGPDFYCPDIDVFREEVSRRTDGHVNLIHTDSGMKADVYLKGEDPLHEWAFARTRRLRIGDLEVSFAPPEYVVLRKLLFYKEGGSQKHLRDVRGLLLMQGDAIDLSKLNTFVDELDLREIWNALEEEAARGT